MQNTPGTRGWSRLRDRTLAVAKNRAKMTFFSGKKNLPKKNIFGGNISSSYAKILGETNFHAREFPRSGWKVEGGEKEEKSKWKQWTASLRPTPCVAHASTPGPKFKITFKMIKRLKFKIKPYLGDICLLQENLKWPPIFKMAL